MLNVIMLSVTCKPFMLIPIVLGVIVMNVAYKTFMPSAIMLWRPYKRHKNFTQSHIDILSMSSRKRKLNGIK